MPVKRSRLLSLTPLLVLALCGCAIFAKRPPTPAARLDAEALNRTQPPPGERYYLLLFGSQDSLRRPKNSHSWATLVRASERAGRETSVEIHTISWLPISLDIHPERRTVEPGTNVELHDTISFAIRANAAVGMWGPYEVSYPFSRRFLVQKGFLDGGTVGYQADDSIGEAARTGDGCDCIHAITDMDPVYPRWRYPLAFYGKPATANIVRRFMHSPIFIDPRTTHDWLIGRLGLTSYAIERWTYRGRVVPYEPGMGGDLSVVRPAILPGVVLPSLEAAPNPVAPSP